MPDESKHQVEYLDVDVLTMAKERIRHVCATFDQIWVAFSGGKDSTVTLHLVEEVLRELGDRGRFHSTPQQVDTASLNNLQQLFGIPADPRQTVLVWLPC